MAGWKGQCQGKRLESVSQTFQIYQAGKLWLLVAVPVSEMSLLLLAASYQLSEGTRLYFRKVLIT